MRFAAPGLVLATLLPSAISTVAPAQGATFLAGSGGVPGGRESGAWVRTHVPEGATMLAIGPSMANIEQFYGRRRAFALSVSTNPLHRNPAYVPLPNPDRAIRLADVQYLIWDSYSASRTRFFERRLRSYISRYHGRAVYTYSVAAHDRDGRSIMLPAIIIYEVRPR